MVIFKLLFMIFQPQGILLGPYLSAFNHAFLCYIWFLFLDLVSNCDQSVLLSS
jgi:hypothetical protein